MRTEEIKKGLLVGVRPSPHRMYEARVVGLEDRKTKNGNTVRGVLVKPKGAPSRVVALAMVRPFDEFKRYLDKFNDDRELTEELKAQAKSLRLNLNDDGISVRVQGPLPRIEVTARGEQASLLVKLIREWFVDISRGGSNGRGKGADAP